MLEGLREKAISLCFAVGLISAILFDRIPAYHVVFGAIGLAGGVVAAALYLERELRARDTECKRECNPNEKVQEQQTTHDFHAVAAVEEDENDLPEFVGRGTLELPNLNDWSTWSLHGDLKAANVVQAAPAYEVWALGVRYRRDPVEDAIKLASSLSSEFEVVIAPNAEIKVRRLSVANQQPATRGLFDDLKESESERVN